MDRSSSHCRIDGAIRRGRTASLPENLADDEDVSAADLPMQR
jgi:hypothetical protein